jgi:hypothetical protein
MKVLLIGLLAVIALGRGELTASANELRYTPSPKMILVECDQNAIQICRHNGITVVISASVTPTSATTKHVGLAA